MPDLEGMDRDMADTCRNVLVALRPILFGDGWDESIRDYAKVVVDEARRRLHRIVCQN